MRWESPYQSEKYHKALQNAGVDTQIIDTSEGMRLFANKLTSDVLTAWEIQLPKNIEGIKNAVVWEYAYEADYNNQQWKDDAYYTAIVTDNSSDPSEKYSSSCRRNINKAQRCKLNHVVNAIDNVDRVVKSFFMTRPELRSGIPIEKFSNVVESFLNCNIADIHTIHREDNSLSAVGIIITSNSIANLRFVSANVETLHERPMNFLYDRVIKYYLNLGFKIVDLSGISAPPPYNGDVKLQGINRFKLSYSTRTVRFDRIKSL